MAARKKVTPVESPVISTDSVDPTEYPEGTHPARNPADVHHSASRWVYSDAKDKPDPSTVAQTVEHPE